MYVKLVYQTIWLYVYAKVNIKLSRQNNLFFLPPTEFTYILHHG